MDPVNTESKLRHKLKVSYWLMVINLIIFVPILRLSYLEANKNQEKIRHMSDQISRLTGKNEVCSKNEATRKDEAKEIEARDIEEKSTCVSNEPWNVYTDTTQKFEISYPTGKFIRFLCPGEGFLLEPRKTWPGINNDLRIMIEGCGRDRRYAVEILTNKVPYEIQETQTYYNIDRQTIILDGGTKAEKLIGTLDMELLVKSEPTDSYYFGVGVPEHFTRIYFQRDSTYYFISFELDDEKLIDSVLSTLRFIE